jgi:ABC-type lipoprotein release transport system permease subunit
MGDYLPYLDQNEGSVLFNQELFSKNKTEGNISYMTTILFIALLVIVILYFYFMIYKKYKEFNNQSIGNLSQTQIDDIENNEDTTIDPSVLNTDFVDSQTFKYKLECSESNCPDLSCGDNEIILRRRDQCCPECINIGGDSKSNDNKFQDRLNRLNQFVNKNISELNFNANLNDIGRNTTKVTFSLIDRISNFNYSSFNLEEFIGIFNRQDEYIYIGIILIFIGIIFFVFN